jgi:hypothetical protein
LNLFRRSIEKFCYRHPRFGIPRLMLYIVIACAAAFLLYMMDTTNTFLYYIGFSPDHILHGQIWRLITWIFYPSSSNLFLLLVMLYFYYFIGTSLENQWGTGQFTIYYIIGVILTIVYGFVVWLATGVTVMLSSYYLNLSMFFAFAVLFPDQQVLLFFIIPIKIKWLAYLDAALFIYSVIVDPFPINLLPIVAVLNFIIFCGGDLLHSIRRPIRVRTSKQTINFKKAAKKIRHEQHQGNYRHKCCVCGRTDVDYPNLEFRYCSRCAGYHCFCEDHINNHIHFTE